MARTKSKNDIKKVMVKKGSTTRKKSSTASSTRKKPTTKKKLVAEDALKKEIEATGEIELVEKTVNRKKTVSEATDKIPVKKLSSEKSTKKELSKDEIVEQRKERNRKKYQNQQKKYQEVSKTRVKKKVVVEDEVDEKAKKITLITQEETHKVDITVAEDLIKKEDIPVSEEKKEKEERKETRKTNRKSDSFTKTLSNIKTKSVDKIHVVKEKTTDRNIPLGKSKEENKTRYKRFIKEAIVYAIILSIIDIGCIYFFDYFNFLRLFDVKYLNIIVTVVILLIFNFFITFMIDYFVTKVWLRSKRKEKDGEQNGDSGVNEEEYRKDIKDKE